ncbi:MAG: GTP cyclohydrolase II RibA [Rhodospirillales bacterium]|nr:GTP cyclohydrolase II RibA [Rhodospirillales bacterium]
MRDDIAAEIWTGILGTGRQLAGERAIAELRAARPVLLSDGAEQRLVAAAETADAGLIEAFRGSAGDLGLVLAAPRLRALGYKADSARRFEVPAASIESLQRLVVENKPFPLPPSRPASALDCAAMQLVKLSFQLPAALVARPGPGRTPQSLLQVSLEAVENFRSGAMPPLRIATRAPVPLEAGTDVEFVVFRGGDGLRDQVAVVVGKPDPQAPVLLRLHSACLTGDLFGSLKCDCGQQLRDAVAAMMQAGGGVLLYLDQEGRGTGLRSKMRAYRLQNFGYDTLEADAVLGYEADERSYRAAGRMLTLLGVSRVAMMTNNPDKLRALADCGIEVTAREPLLGSVNEYNRGYLTTKLQRAGHMLEPEPRRRAPRF